MDGPQRTLSEMFRGKYTYIWNLKSNTDKCMYKPKNKSTIQKTSEWFPLGREGIGEGQVCDRGLRYTNFYVQIGKKKYIVWCREL